MISAGMRRALQDGRIRKLLFVLVAGTLFALFVASRRICLTAYVMSGVLVEQCPDGDFIQTLSVEGWNLRRGGEGTVRVAALASYTLGAADAPLITPVRRFKTTLGIVKPTGEVLLLEPKNGFVKEASATAVATIALPELSDGDYVLRARVVSPVSDSVLDVPLPVYSPARVHVITDRPIYEPGNTVQYRAVALRARDLVPLDGRPGRFEIVDPRGEVVLEERAPAGDFGVASGSFPLDLGAEVGDWRVRWVSGSAQDTVSFRVEPFSLPRFSIEANAAKPFYRIDERPRVRGRVHYSSGAPVQGATLELEWRVLGAWPPPPDWAERALPRSARADASGGFELELPVVPRDLRGRVTLTSRIVATDAALDRVEGGVSVLLSEDAIDVSTVTELGDGLVAGANNRVFFRVTTAAGALLSDTELWVRRAWDPSDKGTRAMTDVDGVASIQIDPGPPVNAIVPPMPFRPPPERKAISRVGAQDLVTGRPPSLADQRAMDLWDAFLEPCARFVAQGVAIVPLTLRVDAAGRVDAVVGDSAALGRCFAQTLEGRRLAPGAARLFTVSFSASSDRPSLAVEVVGSPALRPEVDAALRAAALDARVCLAGLLESTPLPRLLFFEDGPRSKTLSVRFVPDPQVTSTLPASVTGCVESKLARIERPSGSTDAIEPEARSTLGFVRLSVEPSAVTTRARPVATTRLGYELWVEARSKDESIGRTKVFLAPGQVPELRLRATPVLARPGDDVEVALVRGPSFNGALPEKLWLRHERGVLEGRVDPKLRTARFSIPSDGRGWFSVEHGAARALVFVQGGSDLEVAITPEKAVYAPGDRAVLKVETKSLGAGTSAAVGLFGVDSSLSQIATLRGPDDLARVRPHPTMLSNAFGVLDAAALEQGRIRGPFAAQATVLRVLAIPTPSDLDASVSVQSSATFDPTEALTDHFYPLLAELHDAVRAWEETAPKGELMEPATMARLWARTLELAKSKKLATTDAFGRELRLSRLPGDLLALTDPRAVVVDATRLPEDVENWSSWVQKERP